MKKFLFIFLFLFFINFQLIVFAKNTGKEKLLVFNPKNNILLFKPYLIIDDLLFYENMKSYSFSKKHFEAFLKIIRRGGIDRENIVKDYNKIRIKSGSELMKYVSYFHFKKFFIFLSKKAMRSNDDSLGFKDFKVKQNVESKFFYKNKIIKYLVGNDIKLRFKIIESMLGGLLNFDPRVRLMSISFLRRLVVDQLMWSFINKRIENQVLPKLDDNFNEDVNLYNFSHETVKRTKYNYHSFDLNKLFYGKLDKGIVYSEMLKLRRFISRFLLLDVLKKDDNLIKNIPEEVFYLLVEPIDGEHFCNLPINYLNTDEYVVGLILGLENNSKFVRDKVALSLIRIIRTNDIDIDIKLHIFKILLENKNYRSYLISGWSLDESNNFSDLDLLNIMNLYIDSHNSLVACVNDSNDQYDAGYSVNKVFVDYKDNIFSKPVLKNQYLKKEDKELENSLDLNNFNSVESNKINTIYIFD